MAAIIDPNTGLKVWESGAIIQYLIQQYDTDQNVSYDSFPEKHHTDQWLFFQVSGQGPYFGQFAWFNSFHPESVQSAKDRYRNEVKRVTHVIDMALDGKEWLVGDKCTYADLSFVTSYGMILLDPVLTAELEKNNPAWSAWIERLNEKASVKEARKIKADEVARLQAKGAL